MTSRVGVLALRGPIGALALVAAMATVLAGCAGGGEATEDDKTLTIAVSGPPASLDPLKTNNGGFATTFQSLAYEPLIEKASDGSYAPGLAEEWGYVDGSGGTQFDLTLRDGVEFADGTAVSGDAVADSINYFAANATGPSAGSFKGLSASATGDLTVRISSEQPNPVIPDLLTPMALGGNVISPAGLEADRSNAMFGAGPYVYDASDSVAGDHYTFVPNENYFESSKVEFEKVVVRVIASNSSALQALRSGQVDLMAGDTTQVNAAEDAGLTVYASESTFSVFWLMDFKGQLVPALGDKRVRQALNYAIDREAITKAVYGDSGSATSQTNTPGWDAYDAELDDAYPFDPDKAKELLAEAGYPDGFEFSTSYITAPDGTKIAQAVAAQLAEVGVTMNLKASTNAGELISDIATKNYSAIQLGWAGQTLFEQFGTVWVQGAIVNPWNSTVDGIADLFAAYTSSTADTRQETAQAVQKQLVEEAVAIPVARFDGFVFATPSLKGFELISGTPNDPAGWSLSG